MKLVKKSGAEKSMNMSLLLSRGGLADDLVGPKRHTLELELLVLSSLQIIM